MYTGVTVDLVKRIYQHTSKDADGFSSKYNLNKLVYYEIFDDLENAFIREKQIKAGSRAKKIKLIQSMNPEFKDLYPEILKN